MFLHGGWFHLISNMWFLYIFGDNVEARMGGMRYLIFYLLSGVAAVVLQTYLLPESSVPMIGASGAIAGVLGAYLISFPRSRIGRALKWARRNHRVVTPVLATAGLGAIDGGDPSRELGRGGLSSHSERMAQRSTHTGVAIARKVNEIG